MLGNLRVSLKLSIGFGVVLMLMAAVSILSYVRMNQASYLMQKRDMYGEIVNHISDARLDRNRFFYTGNPEFSSNVNRYFEDITAITKQGLEQYTSQSDSENLNSLLQSVAEYQKYFNEYTDMIIHKKKLIEQMGKSGMRAFDLAENSGSSAVLSNLLMMRITTMQYIFQQADTETETIRASYYRQALEEVSDSPGSAADKGELRNVLGSYHTDFIMLAEISKQIAITEQNLSVAATQAQNLCLSLREEVRSILNENIARAEMLIIIISLLAITAGIAIGFVISRSITVPMQKAVAVADAMSSGNFTVSLELNQKDEIGQFARALENMRIQLKQLIELLIQSSNSVASGSTELASTTEELSTTFSDQASQVSMVAAAVEELSASSAQVLDSIGEVNGKSGKAKDYTFQGQQCIGAVNEVMGTIRNNVEELGSTVSELAKSSEEIGSILLVINDIADQTNLLALNAAIEAARAGEHGRGFAVVADEVRKLAERTQTSIHEIENIISLFVNETGKTNREMESAKGRVLEGVDRLNETNDIFSDIVTSVEEINDASSIITEAIKEQVASIQNINDNAHVISSGLEESSAALVQVTATVGDLQKQADEQMESTAVFVIQ